MWKIQTRVWGERCRLWYIWTKLICSQWVCQCLYVFHVKLCLQNNRMVWPWTCFVWVSCCFVMRVGGLTFLRIVLPWCGHTYILKQKGWGGQRSWRSAVTWSLPSCTAHSRHLLGSKNIKKLVWNRQTNESERGPILFWKKRTIWNILQNMCSAEERIS